MLISGEPARNKSRENLYCDVTTPVSSAQLFFLHHTPNTAAIAPDSFTTHIARNNMSEDLYVINDIPGRGKGMFATRNISRGTCIISEKPLLYAGRDRETVMRAVANLSMMEKMQFYALFNVYPESELPRDQGIVKTNALPLGSNSIEGAVFRIISRINHSCAPNVTHAWNAKHKKEDIWAIQDIQEGDEIRTNYIPMLWTRAERQKELRKNFRFTCDCEACTLQDSDAHDRIITRINECSDLILRYTMRDPKKAIQCVREALDLLDKIGGRGKTTFFYDAFQIYAIYSNYELAKKWAKLYLDEYRLETGESTAEYPMYLSYSEEPRRFTQAGWGGYVDLSGA